MHGPDDSSVRSESSGRSQLSQSFQTSRASATRSTTAVVGNQGLYQGASQVETYTVYDRDESDVLCIKVEQQDQNEYWETEDHADSGAPGYSHTSSELYADENWAEDESLAAKVLSLPDGWVQYLSVEGWPYYYNLNTKESSWERPEGDSELESFPEPYVKSQAYFEENYESYLVSQEDRYYAGFDSTVNQSSYTLDEYTEDAGDGQGLVHNTDIFDHTYYAKSELHDTEYPPPTVALYQEDHLRYLTSKPDMNHDFTGSESVSEAYQNRKDQEMPLIVQSEEQQAEDYSPKAANTPSTDGIGSEIITIERLVRSPPIVSATVSVTESTDKTIELNQETISQHGWKKSPNNSFNSIGSASENSAFEAAKSGLSPRRLKKGRKDLDTSSHDIDVEREIITLAVETARKGSENPNMALGSEQFVGPYDSMQPEASFQTFSIEKSVFSDELVANVDKVQELGSDSGKLYQYSMGESPPISHITNNSRFESSLHKQNTNHLNNSEANKMFISQESVSSYTFQNEEALALTLPSNPVHSVAPNTASREYMMSRSDSSNATGASVFPNLLSPPKAAQDREFLKVNGDHNRVQECAYVPLDAMDTGESFSEYTMQQKKSGTKLAIHEVAWLQYEQSRDVDSLSTDIVQLKDEKSSRHVDMVEKSEEGSTSSKSMTNTQKLARKLRTKKDSQINRKSAAYVDSAEIVDMSYSRISHETATMAEPAAEWQQYYTANGDVYYYNLLTEQVQWEDPYSSEPLSKDEAFVGNPISSIDIHPQNYALDGSYEYAIDRQYQESTDRHVDRLEDSHKFDAVKSAETLYNTKERNAAEQLSIAAIDSVSSEKALINQNQLQQYNTDNSSVSCSTSIGKRPPKRGMVTQTAVKKDGVYHVVATSNISDRTRSEAYSTPPSARRFNSSGFAFEKFEPQYSAAVSAVSGTIEKNEQSLQGNYIFPFPQSDAKTPSPTQEQIPSVGYSPAVSSLGRQGKFTSVPSPLNIRSYSVSSLSDNSETESGFGGSVSSYSFHYPSMHPSSPTLLNNKPIDRGIQQTNMHTPSGMYTSTASTTSSNLYQPYPNPSGKTLDRMPEAISEVEETPSVESKTAQSRESDTYNNQTEHQQQGTTTSTAHRGEYSHNDDSSQVSGTSLSEDTHKHLQIWNRFFENAFSANMTKDGRTGDVSDTLSSDGSLGSRASRAAKLLASAAASVATYHTESSQKKIVRSGKWPRNISDQKYSLLLSEALPDQVSGDKRKVGNTLKSIALIAAVMRDDVGVVEQLLLAGANPNCVDDQIRTPAHFACRSGNEEILALLYDYSADLEARDVSNRSPLHIACIYSKRLCVELLLGCAVDCNAVDDQGNSPLHLACRSGSLLCCSSLLQFGADVELLNSYGVNALTIAMNIVPRSAELDAIVTLLQESDPVQSSMLLSSLDSGYPEDPILGDETLVSPGGAAQFQKKMSSPEKTNLVDPNTDKHSLENDKANSSTLRENDTNIANVLTSNSKTARVIGTVGAEQSTAFSGKPYTLYFYRYSSLKNIYDMNRNKTSAYRVQREGEGQ